MTIPVVLLKLRREIGVTSICFMEKVSESAHLMMSRFLMKRYLPEFLQQLSPHWQAWRDLWYILLSSHRNRLFDRYGQTRWSLTGIAISLSIHYIFTYLNSHVGLIAGTASSDCFNDIRPSSTGYKGSSCISIVAKVCSYCPSSQGF